MTSAAQLLAASALPASEARALLAHVLGTTRESLIARPEQTLAASSATAFERLAARRRQGEPLAYLLGIKEFYGRPFKVDARVLVPRPETELLVETALRLLPDNIERRVLDLGTGSGCIAITLSLERRSAELVATDLSKEALGLAAANAEQLNASNLHFNQGRWYEAVGDQRFDLIVSNPPYVAAGDPHLAALSFEPACALTDGSDGLACLRAVVGDAHSHLNTGGWLAVEHGYDQAAQVRLMFSQAGFEDVTTSCDLAGIERVTAGRGE